MTFDFESRRTLEQLADRLIPAGAEMPSATQADIVSWCQVVLQSRPEWTEPFWKLIHSAQGQAPKTHLENLCRNDGAAFRLLSEVICNAYFMNPDVQRAIGYQGQVPKPIDPNVEPVEPSLLEPVIRRGPIYRPTPATLDNSDPSDAAPTADHASG